MATQFYQESAIIYQFPKGSRQGIGSSWESTQAAKFAKQDICYEALDNCWYHNEAVRADADEGHKDLLV